MKSVFWFIRLSALVLKTKERAFFDCKLHMNFCQIEIIFPNYYLRKFM